MYYTMRIADRQGCIAIIELLVNSWAIAFAKISRDTIATVLRDIRQINSNVIAIGQLSCNNNRSWPIPLQLRSSEAMTSIIATQATLATEAIYPDGIPTTYTYTSLPSARSSSPSQSCCAGASRRGSPSEGCQAWRNPQLNKRHLASPRTFATARAGWQTCPSSPISSLRVPDEESQMRSPR